MNFEKLALVERFDQDGDGKLSTEERQEARAYVKENARGRGGRRGPFGPPREPRREQTEPSIEPERLAPKDVPRVGKDKGLYDLDVVRTLFFTFEADDWMEELADFHRTDVEVPAGLVVDGKAYTSVGMRYRGNTSFMMVPEGKKRSFNVSIDYADEAQRLYGFKTLNLLNAASDPSFLREVAFLHVIGRFFTSPRANLVRVVINGEDWGIYVNVEQYNKDFMERAFGSRKGVRFKVPPEFGGTGGLVWLGEERAAYERVYQLKSSLSAKREEKAWNALIELCRVVSQTSVEERAQALPTIFDVRGALQMIAVEQVVGDGDGYISRASDYVLIQDKEGVFHMLPHDSNETFSEGEGGPGGPGGPGGRGGRRGGRRGPGGRDPFGQGGPLFEADDLPSPPEQGIFALANEPARPLFRKLIAVPEWRAWYVEAVREAIAATRWETLGPVLAKAHGMIAPFVKKDARKLYGYDAFEKSLDGPDETRERPEFGEEEDPGFPPGPEGRRGPGGRRGGPPGFFGASRSIKSYLQERHRELASDPALRAKK